MYVCKRLCVVMCTGVCNCVSVCKCVQVCASVCECVRVCIVVCVYAYILTVVIYLHYPGTCLRGEDCSLRYTYIIYYINICSFAMSVFDITYPRNGTHCGENHTLVSKGPYSMGYGPIL